MGDRLIISDNREDPGNPLVLDGEAIDAAAQDPLAIGDYQKRCPLVALLSAPNKSYSMMAMPLFGLGD
jgi:hypothetical protein